MKFGIANILLPTDFSPRTLGAVRYASVLAQQFHSKLTLLYVLPPLNVAYEVLGGGGVCLDQVFASQKEYFQEKLNSFLVNELRQFEVTRVLIEGDPAETILGYSRAQKVDLIVIPTRGCGMFRRFILGSVTAKVLHDAPCPVWTGVHVEETSVDSSWELRHVLCAVDPVSGDEAAICWAAELASAFEARLSIVHAIPSPAFHAETYYLESELQRLHDHDFRDRISKMLGAGKMPNAEIHIQCGPVARVVRSIAQDYRADVIVIGHGANTGLAGRLHTNAYAIVRESPCPVVSV